MARGGLIGAKYCSFGKICLSGWWVNLRQQREDELLKPLCEEEEMEYALLRL